MAILFARSAGGKGTKKLHEKGRQELYHSERSKTGREPPWLPRGPGRKGFPQGCAAWEDQSPRAWIPTAVPQRHLVSSWDNMHPVILQSWALDRKPEHLLPAR